MAGKRPHAVYCSRSCKTAASDARRREDGRARARDTARYLEEAPKRRSQAIEAYDRNRAAYVERSRQWRRDHPVEKNLQEHLRRARKRGNVGSLKVSARDWHRLLVAADFRCTYCHEAAPLVKDHVIPLARGGRHAVGNIVPACSRCNSSKGSAFLASWRARKRREVSPNPIPSSGAHMA